MSTSHDDPTHGVSAADTLWTRVNTSEATPGVITPLALGLLPLRRAGHAQPARTTGVSTTSRRSSCLHSVDDNWTGAFFGRVALNVDALREMYDRMPGTSADEFELTMLGSVRPDAKSRPTPSVMHASSSGATRSSRRSRRTIERLYVEVDAWWKAEVHPDAVDDVDGAAARWLDARDRLGEVMRPHTTGSLFAMEGYASLARACATAGKLDLLSRLTSGYGDTEDDRMSAALWDAAHGVLPRAELIARYGYQGDRAGDLAARVWREDPTVLDPMLEALGSMDEQRRPARHRSASCRGPRRCGGGAPRRTRTRPARRDPQRDRGDTPLHRAPAAREGHVLARGRRRSRRRPRTLGRSYCARGLLADPDDTYFLVADELVPTLAPDARERVAFRRARHREYEAVEIPLTWVGNPVPQPIAPRSDSDRASAVTGIGVCPGVVEGRARRRRRPGDR